jgi:hypothetical protein
MAAHMFSFDEHGKAHFCKPNQQRFEPGCKFASLNLCAYTNLLGASVLMSEEKTSTQVAQTSFSMFHTQKEERK